MFSSLSLAKVMQTKENTKKNDQKERGLKIENSFITHVEEQVEDAQVGQEAMLRLIDLIVRFRQEGVVCERLLRSDGFAIVDEGGNGRGLFGGRQLGTVLLGQPDVGVYVQQFTHLLHDSQVEVEESIPLPLFKEWAQVVFIIVEERTLAVC